MCKPCNCKHNSNESNVGNVTHRDTHSIDKKSDDVDGDNDDDSDVVMICGAGVGHDGACMVVIITIMITRFQSED